VVRAGDGKRGAVMPLRAWNKIDFHDPSTGDMAVRYQGFSGHGTYWLTRPAAPGGKSRREQRDWALTLIEEAIETGAEPGEVPYREMPPPTARF
jgi:hypothetical protein